MSNQPTRKGRGPLNLNQIKEYTTANPKSMSNSDNYGKSVWVDAAEWEDGRISLTGYDPETKKRFNIGFLDFKADNQSAPTKENFKNASTEDDGLPF